MSGKRIGKSAAGTTTRKSRTVRMTRTEIDKAQGRTDWARLDAMSDAEIRAAVDADPDAAPELDREWFARAKRLVDGVVPEPKQSLSIRLDRSVLEWFRAQGPRYQSRINAVLRAYVATQSEGSR